MAKIDEKAFIGEKEINKYKEFAFKEDMLKMSIAFILGASFNKVVTGISDLIIMPIINFVIIQTGDTWRRWSVEPIHGLKLEIGQFLGVLIDFILISMILYIIYMKIISRITSNRSVAQNKKCPLCVSEINIMAKKCPKCTGDLSV
jgi:large conductance mechanosensitive channel